MDIGGIMGPMGKQGTPGEILNLAGAKTIKKHVSQILKEKRTWMNVIGSDGVEPILPEIGEKVVVRLYTKNFVFGEDDKHIYVAEDIKVGIWDGEKWEIAGPHPRYDYSPLNDKSELREGCVVTHWAEPETGERDELKGWESRFDKITDIPMKLTVDPGREEDVYRALLFGSFGLTQIAQTGMINDSPEKIRMYHAILCDLQGSIDFPEEGESGDGETSAE